MAKTEKSKELADKLYPNLTEEEINESILTIPPEQRRLHTETYDFSVSTIIDYLKERKLVVPEFQRRYVWSATQASRLIESLVIQCPIPVLYFNQERDETLSVIDGNQRITTLRKFANDEFPLKGLTAYPELEGLKYSDLDARFQRHIMNRTLRCITIMKDTHPQVKFDVFERLNTGAVKLTPQEIRHGIYYGPLMKLVERLAELESFIEMLPGYPERRMKAEEYVLRFLSLHYNMKNYHKPLSSFLNEFSDKNRSLSDADGKKYEGLFKRTVSGVRAVYGDLAFKTFDGKLRVTSNFNAALLDAEMLSVSKLGSGVDGLSDAKRKAFLAALARLFKDEKFAKSIGRATSDEQSIHYRVETLAGLLSRYV